MALIALLALLVAVIVALPVALAVTTPFSSTEAMLALEEVQSTLFSLALVGL